MKSILKCYKVRVFDKDKNLIGHCAVLVSQVPGSKFVVAVAEEGEYCATCKARHTDFRDIIFDICLYGESELGLMVRKPEDAKHLPGFKEN